jgi:hypothetical protein
VPSSSAALKIRRFRKLSVNTRAASWPSGGINELDDCAAAIIPNCLDQACRLPRSATERFTRHDLEEVDRQELPTTVEQPACFLRISSLDSLERHDVLLNVSGQVYANNHPEPPLSASAVRLFELQRNAVLMTMQKAHRDVRTRARDRP